MSSPETVVPRDLRLPVALVFVGTAIGLVQLLMLLSTGPLSLFDSYGAYVIGVTGLSVMTSAAAILRRWVLFLCAGAALYTLNAAVTLAAPGGGVLELLGFVGSPCVLRWALYEYSGLYLWNGFVLAWSMVGCVLFWSALGRRVQV